MSNTKTYWAAVCVVSLWACVQIVSAAPSIPSRAPDHAWLFDEGAGVTVAPLTGENEGTLVSVTTWSTNVPFSYEGNHSVNIGGGAGNVTASGHTVGTAGTISMWVNTTSTGIQYLFDSLGTRTMTYIDLGGTGTEYTYINGVSVGGGNWADASSFPTGQWHHVAVVWDNAGSPVKVEWH
ncbi:MAG: hypothetical protein HQ559_16175 [Lentisphaerae bacterium]|nr:hypothetical protein [Lentisphaerota bacterium]